MNEDATSVAALQEIAAMNGDELPGLLNALGAWVRQNRDPNTGLVFGATVREPTEEQTIKTYAFTCDDEIKHYSAIVWQFGNVNVQTADFSKSPDRPNSEVFYCEEFEFEETSHIIEKLDSFFKEHSLCGGRSEFAYKTAS